MPAMVVGRGCWWSAAEADAGASGAAFPRWSVGTIPLRSPSGYPVAGWALAPPGGWFGAGRVSGEENSPLALSRAAGCGTGKKGQAV